MVDDFCHSRSQKRRLYGPDASLNPSEVVTLAIFSRWSHLNSERDFCRYATDHLHNAFPTLPDRSQFNRLVCSQVGLIEEIALHLATAMEAKNCTYQALDSSAIPVRDAKREGERDGSPDRPTSDGAIVRDGMRDFACSSLLTPQALQ
jgi:hypothetical protein